MSIRHYLFLAAGLMALVAGAAQACPNHSTSHGSKSAVVLTPPASHAAVVAWKSRAWAPTMLTPAQAQGLRVAIDPVDGTMSMPAADELQQRIVIDENTPVDMLRRSNGSLRATLDDRFAEFAVVTLGVDGKPSWTCVHGTQGAERFMKQPAPAAVSATRAPSPGTVWEVR